MNGENGLRRHLTPMGAWAFSIGTSIGWGSLVVTANTYLAQAGPWGSALGLAAGALVMLLIARNYAYLIQSYPDAGGAYAYTREVFGYDQAFLAAWFLTMTYLAVLWANATSLPLFVRIFMGGALRFGWLYTLFGYDVYLGEALLSAASMALTGFLLIKNRKLAHTLMIILTCLFSAGIVICFICAVIRGTSSPEPGFLPDSAAVSQIVKIAVISPWAFIGFESISHATEEFDFERGKTRRVLLISVLTTLLLYVAVTLLSVTAYPPEYENWLAYIGDLDRLEGIKALPAFYAADRYLGGTGVTLLMLSLLALVITSLIGNMTALSRLFYALAKDKVLPARFAKVNENGVPVKAVMLVMAFSFLIPLAGRTAIGWIVDVTTIGGTLIYGFVSACAAKAAKKNGEKRGVWLGRLGVALMIVFGVYLLLPNLVAKGSMAKESYFLFIVWSVLSFVSFRTILHRDKEKRFGSSIIVWIGILALVLFISLIWMRQSMIASNDKMLANVQAYYEQDIENTHRMEDNRFIAEQVAVEQEEDTRTILMTVGMFTFTLAIMLTNHSYMNQRSMESERLANIDPMTGVKNKHAFQVAEEKLDKAIREGAADEFAIVVCDVNGLKKINDTQGHKAGDEYIRLSCRMFCEIFQHSPVFRVGGDEFVAILTGRDYAVRTELMMLTHDRSAEHILTGGAVISAGMAEYSAGEDTSAHDVFERADKQMYTEKKVLKGLGAVVRDESESESSLLAAIDHGPAILDVKRYLLIVEDEQINQMILGDALKNEYEILYASDGVAALEQVITYKNDLAAVLLDLQMPRMGGMEVLKRLKDDQDTRKIPVIVLTVDQSSEVDCLRMGAMDFITKPYPAIEIIRARVNKCIELSENREIIHSTERDSLTQLFNIDYFHRYVNLFDQHFADKPMDAIAVDVNHFRMLNERYGKQFGLIVLQRVGESIRKIAREIGGVGCRNGGDVFLIYCPHREDYEDLLNRISDCLSKDETTANRVRLRMGVYASVDKTLDIERRFEYAKTAANTVRNGYPKSVALYDSEMLKEEMFKERLYEDFRPSIEQGRFIVYYQPKFNIRSEQPILASAEALVRWDHADLGLLSPADFIPILEENGLILELDRYVWREVAARVRAWKDSIGFSVPISVNVSRIDMLNPNLKDIFMDILEAYHLTVEDIALEITESAYTGNTEQVISTVEELRAMGMGFRIEMDDFGTGYSSLGMLTHLPIDALKLDMSFVRSAFGEARNVRMIELIIDIADYLHVPVVAEGVETEEQYLVLKAMGCDLVQGYYFSRPVPPEAFERFLIERKNQHPEMPPEPEKANMSVSEMLNGDFERVYYIDMVTDFYLEFYSGQHGEFEIRPAGTDFFGAARAKLLSNVAAEDKEAVGQAISKANMMTWLGREEIFSLSYHRLVDGEEKPYRLQSIRTQKGDDHHMVLGIRPERPEPDAAE